jgi:hypothetical protein
LVHLHPTAHRLARRIRTARGRDKGSGENGLTFYSGGDVLAEEVGEGVADLVVPGVGVGLVLDQVGEAGLEVVRAGVGGGGERGELGRRVDVLAGEAAHVAARGATPTASGPNNVRQKILFA